MTKPFRFAVQTSSAPDGKAWRDKARKIEDLGYSTLFIPDHFGDQWGPLVALTIAAEATDRLNVGTLVLDNDYRHPVVVAKEIATLDLASGGRVEFGLGAGWLKSDYDESGIAYDEPSVRVDRMVEGLRIMKQMWRGGVADLRGSHYAVTGAKGDPRPASATTPKILIGGGGRKVLTVAAQEADIVGINPNLRSGAVNQDVAKSAVASLYKERLEWVREAAGERFDDLELQCLTFFVVFTDDPRSVAENLAPGFGVTPEDALEMPIALAGTVDSMVDTLQQRREELGISYLVVHEPEMEQFGEVVARLAGS
ncbi:MAG TPA: TIGR03621 family F420-dependent LLM class oxidoreductase [Acidimicrobiales bacterium]|nr:TIGR03621 family F420-dependent LLM class oxidoreductase [Acidimicrobiales bacterium]